MKSRVEQTDRTDLRWVLRLSAAVMSMFFWGTAIAAQPRWDDVVRGALGDALAQEFIALKRMEWTEYSRSVSGWETDRYLEMF